MGVFDWLIKRSASTAHPAQDPSLLTAIEKAVALTNSRIKLVRGYQARLKPGAGQSIAYLREHISALPPAILFTAAAWGSDPLLKALFVAAADIPQLLARSTQLRSFFDLQPEQHEVYFMLDMRCLEKSLIGMSLQANTVGEREQTFINFSDHQVRICGAQEIEVRQLLGVQCFEYLVAQALAKIGGDRAERKELEENRSVLRLRLRLLQQEQGLGAIFSGSQHSEKSTQAGQSAQASSTTSLKTQQEIEAKLLDNERQLDALGSTQTVLDNELECLCSVLEEPARYLSFEHQQVFLDSSNVLMAATDFTEFNHVSNITFPLAHLMGEPTMRRAFVLARVLRADLPLKQLNFAAAANYL